MQVCDSVIVEVQRVGSIERGKLTMEWQSLYNLTTCL